MGLIDVARTYLVRIDGQPVGRLDNGSEGRFAVPAGTHHVDLRLDWTGSKPIEIRVDQGEVVGLVVRWKGRLLSRTGWLRLESVSAS